MTQTTSEWLGKEFPAEVVDESKAQYVIDSVRQDMLVRLGTAIAQQTIHWLPGIVAFKIVYEKLPGSYSRAAFRELWFRGVLDNHWTMDLYTYGQSD